MRYAFCRGVVPPGQEDSNVPMNPSSANVVRVALLTTEFRRRAAALILKTEGLFYGRN